MSNLERIKEMDLEELAWFLFDVFQHNLEKGFLEKEDAVDFLKSEVSENE